MKGCMANGFNAIADADGLYGVIKGCENDILPEVTENAIDNTFKIINDTDKESTFHENSRNLKRVYLPEVDLSKKDFSGVDLSYANLKGATLNEARLSGATVIGANLENALLRKAKLTLTNFTDANLYNADLTQATGYAPIFTEANLGNASLDKAHFKEILHNQTVLKPSFEGAQLQATNIEGAIIQEGIFTGSNMQGARVQSRLKKAELIGTNLEGACLRSTDLYDSAIIGCNMNYTDLGETEVHESTIYSTDIKDADLKNALIYKSRIAGVDFKNSNISNLQIVGSKELKDTSFKDTIQTEPPKITIINENTFLGEDSLPERPLGGFTHSKN